MRKSQFINQKGIAVTVTRLDGTSYQTRMLYHRISRSKGSFAPNYAFSINYMRGGVFKPNDDIQNGYLVTVTNTGEQMFVEASSPTVFMGEWQSISTELLVVNYPNVQLKRYSPGEVDMYGNPTSQPTWNLIGTYPANVDYQNGKATYKSELLLPSTVLMVNMQKTVPVQLDDRIVVNGTNYRVDALDYNSSIGLVLCQMSLDMRS